MKHAIFRILPAAALFCLAAAAAAERPAALGVIDYYAKYDANTAGRTADYGRGQQAAIAALQTNFPAAQRVDVDLLLKPGRAARDRYARLVILPHSTAFTEEMLASMADYVMRGGLLIACDSLVYLDGDKNYRHDDADPITRYAENGFLGVQGVGHAVQHEIKALEAGPLTAGLPVGAWLELAGEVGGRATQNRSARVAVMARQRRGGRTAEAPFVTYKSYGKGACVYLAGGLGLGREDALGQIAKNVFSAETLKALCVQ